MSSKMVEQIKDLIKLDLDAVEIYHKCLQKIERSDLADRLSMFADEHQRHVDQLSAYMESIGETPPKRKKDMKGYFLEGFAAIRSMGGETGALKALESSEKLTNKTYSKAVNNEALDAEAKQIVMDNYQDEKKHFAFVQQELKTHV